MEPSPELLELLTEVRDKQRELLDLTKKWKELSDLRDQEWQAESARIKAANELATAKWDEANARWLQDSRLPFRLIVIMLSHWFLAVAGAVLGVVAATHWLK